MLDVGFDLADTAAGERAYAESHIAGASYVHLDRDLSTTKNGRNGRHPLPSRDVFARTVGRLGITPATQVVAYDRQGGVYAARLWWMLRSLGHDAVAVLDGGFAAWLDAGGAVTNGAGAGPLPETGEGGSPYPDRPSLAPSVDAVALQQRLGRVVLLDARAAPRFRGEVEPFDAVAGHIPGATNRPFADNLGGDGRFKPAAELRAAFALLLGAKPAGEVIHSCGSGVTACHNLLAMEHAGLAGSQLYPGSWSEWSSDPNRPIARG